MSRSLYISSLLLLVAVSPSVQQQSRSENGTDVIVGTYVEVTHPCVILQELEETSLLAGNDPPFVPATAAMACLDTVPIDLDMAQSFLSKLPNYLSFQSTMPLIANPPPGSSYKPVDMLAGLKSIGEDIRNGRFSSQIRFEDAVTKLFISAHDENLSVEFGASSVIRFTAPFGLAMLSKDGKNGGIYVDEDVYADYDDKSASAVTRIDGMDVVEYLTALSEFDPAVSADARWNNLFATNSRTTRSVGSEGSFKNRIVNPFATSFSMSFDNGTTMSFEYFAVVMKDMTGVDSGEDFFKTFVVPGKGSDVGDDTDAFDSEGSDAISPSSDEDSLSRLKRRDNDTDLYYPDGGIFQGYPYTNCLARDPNDRVAGFKMDGSFVLAITSFSAQDENHARDFQSTVQQIIQAGKGGNITTKLMIDIKGCGGDANFLAYDTIQQLFPQVQPYTAQRMRNTPALDLLLSSYAEQSSPAPSRSINTSMAIMTESSDADRDSDAIPYQPSFLTPLIHSLNATLQPFTSFPSSMLSDGDYTNIFRTDLSDPMSYGSFLTLSGHGELKNATKSPPVFYPENIVLITDGSSSGACSLFAEMLTHQLDIRSVAVGGRVNTPGVIDVVGGSKGVKRLSSTELLRATDSYIRSSLSSSSEINRDILPQPFPLNAVVYVNLIDNIRPVDGGGNSSTPIVPLQFMSESKTKCDCRIFMDAEAHMDPGRVWGEVADMAWNPTTQKQCAYGSLNVNGRPGPGCGGGGGSGGNGPNGGGSAGATVMVTMTVDLGGYPTATALVTGIPGQIPNLGPTNSAGALDFSVRLLGSIWAAVSLMLAL